MTARRKATLEVLEALCEALCACPGVWLGASDSPEWNALSDAHDAYRSATAPLRTRAEVDAEIAGYVRSKTMVPLGACFFDMTKLSRLCSEPTRDEPET